jgi:hypothetical protein
MVTCRALAERFGLTVSTRQWTNLERCTAAFRAKVRSQYPPATDGQVDALWDVLVAANRAVCHLEDTLIDHRVDSSKLRLAVALIDGLVHQEMRVAGLTLS